MMRITKRKALILLAMGMFVIAISQVLSYYIVLPDLMKGSFIGIGLGLLLLATVLGTFRTVK